MPEQIKYRPQPYGRSRPRIDWDFYDPKIRELYKQHGPRWSLILRGLDLIGLRVSTIERRVRHLFPKEMEEYSRKAKIAQALREERQAAKKTPPRPSMTEHPKVTLPPLPCLLEPVHVIQNR